MDLLNTTEILLIIGGCIFGLSTLLHWYYLIKVSDDKDITVDFFTTPIRIIKEKNKILNALTLNTYRFWLIADFIRITTLVVVMICFIIV